MTLQVRELSPPLLATAIQKLNEDPSTRVSEVHDLRDWLCKQPHINARPDDQTLITFLRGCKFSLEKTKKKLDMYYTMRTAIPEFFREATTKNNAVQLVINSIVTFPLPETDELGRRLVCLRPLPAKDGSSLDDILKLHCMAVDYMMREDDAFLINGAVYIVDLTWVTMGMILHCTPSFAKKAIVSIQECYPVRPQVVHFLHAPVIFNGILSMVKMFSTAKFGNRIFSHGSEASLHEHVPQILLPEEYGGTAGSIQQMNDKWKETIEAFEPWFDTHQDDGVIESLRPKPPNRFDTVLDFLRR